MHYRSMIYGYARVSTEAQELRSQLAQLKAAGCEKIFQEKESRMREDRPQLEKLLKSLKSNDVLIVVATDRLGGGPRLLLNILDAIRTSGAGFKSLAEPHINTTASPELAEMVFFWVGWAARWEWQRIRARTATGRAEAKLRGVAFGRKTKLTDHQKREALARLATGEETQRAIARSYNVSQSTIARLRLI